MIIKSNLLMSKVVSTNGVSVIGFHLRSFRKYPTYSVLIQSLLIDIYKLDRTFLSHCATYVTVSGNRLGDFREWPQLHSPPCLFASFDATVIDECYNTWNRFLRGAGSLQDHGIGQEKKQPQEYWRGNWYRNVLPWKLKA